MKLLILLVIITTILAAYDDHDNQIAWWDLDDNAQSPRRSKNIPFPQCMESGRNSKSFDSSAIRNLFDKAFRDEEYQSNREGYENNQKDYHDVMDYDADEYRKSSNRGTSRISATAALKLTGQLMRILTCDLNGTDTNNLNKVLSKFKVPGEFCSYLDRPSCDNKTMFRTASGFCNNFDRPYEGNSHTKYGRFKPARYSDHLSKPYRHSVRGGNLPSCRKISLSLGSKPVFDRDYNNLFVIYGQYISHDITLAAPVTDNYLTPITTCSCDSKDDWNRCNVIDISPDDPMMSGQKCMAFPATAQAFSNEFCSLGVKEQLNVNTHFADLSGLYGSTLTVQNLLRGPHGSLKASKPYGAKYECPPGQKRGKACIDARPGRPCVTGGDPRVMENLLLTAIQATFLRLHNIIAAELHQRNPTASSDLIYEVTRRLTTEVFQVITFGYWAPKLLGGTYGTQLLKQLTTKGYDPNVTAVVYNEVATAAGRCHTLVRDLYSRCTPEGKRIDELWLHDISHKAEYLYDHKNNGLDSFLCGSLYDYGFAHDGNIAHQMHNRLFESTSSNGNLWRNDLVAINICRGREHGLESYNTYREYCGLKKAYYFEDFGNTMNYDAIKLLSRLYQHPEDVDLFVGLVLEDKLKDGLVGRVSACLLLKQYSDLCVGDRFCITHQYQFTKASLYNTAVTALRFLICKTVDIYQIPNYPFTPPDYVNNMLIDCSQFNQTTNLFTDSAANLTMNGSASVGPSLFDLLNPFIKNVLSTNNPDYLDLSPLT